VAPSLSPRRSAAAGTFSAAPQSQHLCLTKPAWRIDRDGCRLHHQGGAQTRYGTDERADLAAGQFAARFEQDLRRRSENVPARCPVQVPGSSERLIVGAPVAGQLVSAGPA